MNINKQTNATHTKIMAILFVFPSSSTLSNDSPVLSLYNEQNIESGFRRLEKVSDKKEPLESKGPILLLRL